MIPSPVWRQGHGKGSSLTPTTNIQHGSFPRMEMSCWRHQYSPWGWYPLGAEFHKAQLLPAVSLKGKTNFQGHPVKGYIIATGQIDHTSDIFSEQKAFHFVYWDDTTDNPWPAYMSEQRQLLLAFHENYSRIRRWPDCEFSHAWRSPCLLTPKLDIHSNVMARNHAPVKALKAFPSLHAGILEESIIWHLMTTRF